MEQAETKRSDRPGRGWRVAPQRGLAVVAMAGMLAACATIGKDSPDDQKRKAVTEAATARWSAIVKGDPGAAYDEFMSKGSRQVISRSEFVARMKATEFRTAEVEKVECKAEACWATVAITYDHRLMKGVPNNLRENWIIEDGRVWFVWLP